MTWRVVVTDRARRDLRSMDRAAAGRAITAIERRAATEHGDVKRLQGRAAEWRLRVGEYRVRFRFDQAAGSILVLRVLPRQSAYRD